MGIAGRQTGCREIAFAFKSMMTGEQAWAACPRSSEALRPADDGSVTR
jgi:hypothetical protein